MQKEEIKTLENEIKKISSIFKNISKEKKIQIISHFDTDGITSAAIMTQTLKYLDFNFSIKIVKNLDKETIINIPKKDITIFLDLASNSLETIKEANLTNVFIIDHHQISQEIPPEINIINPELMPNKQRISSSGLVYLFCKELCPQIIQFAKLAILGMIGDTLEKEIDILNNNIIYEGDILKKRGILIYPSTRPLNKALEYCSNPFIPGVTGDPRGSIELLREIGLKPNKGKYPSLLELDNDQMQKLVTSIVLRNPKAKEMLGDIFLIKLFNKLEDARELSAKINACSRLDQPEIALQFCLEIPSSKKKADTIHLKYKQNLINALKYVQSTNQITGNNYTIINAKNQIKDTIIGTITSILSNSPIYQEGTIIIGMSIKEDNKIKISARIVGQSKRNLRELLFNIINITGGEVGGHNSAAGAVIDIEKEQEFISIAKKHFELETIKI